MSHYYNKDKLPQYYKIGSKYDNQSYANKNINPEMNFLNKQIMEEERMARVKKAKQLEEFSAFANNRQVSKQSTYTSKVNNDNLTGKIGQECRNIKMGINNQHQEQCSRDDNLKNQRNSLSNGFNIINNSIYGFYDPYQQFPKTSYQANYQAKVNQDLYLQKIPNNQQQQSKAPLSHQTQNQQMRKEVNLSHQQDREYEEMVKKMQNAKIRSDEGQSKGKEMQTEKQIQDQQHIQKQYDIEKQLYEQQMKQREMSEQQTGEIIPENPTEDYQNEEYMRHERMREIFNNNQQQGIDANQPHYQPPEKTYANNQEYAQSSDRNRPVSDDEYKAYMEFMRKTEETSKANKGEQIQSSDINADQNQNEMTEEEYYRYLQNPEQSSIKPEYIQKLQQREMMANQSNINDEDLNPIDAEYIKKLKAYEEIVQGDQQKEYQQQQMISNTERPFSSDQQMKTPYNQSQSQQYTPSTFQQQKMPNYQAICNQIKKTNNLSSIKARNAKTNYISGNPCKI